MQVFVRLFDNRLIVIDTTPDATIQQVKNDALSHVPDLKHPTPEQGTLLLRKPHTFNYLVDNQTIAEQNIQREQNLNLVFRRAPRS